MNQKPTRPMLFFSYARQDEECANRLEKDLQVEGIDVWRDQRNIQGGDDWEIKIRSAIDASSSVLYLGTPAARASKAVRGELEIAEGCKKPIHPVFAIGEHWRDAAPLVLIPRHYFDIREGNYQEGVKRLVDRIKQQSPSNFSIGSLQEEKEDIAKEEELNLVLPEYGQPLTHPPQEPSLLPTIADPLLSPQPHPTGVIPPSSKTSYSKHRVTRRVVLVGLTVGITTAVSLSSLVFFHRFPSSPGTSQHEAEKWKSTRSMLLSRQYFCATPLKNGMVLIEGGFTSNGFDTAESELFNPLTGVWIKTRGRLNERRNQHTATLLLNEKVLITGGYSPEEGRASAEIYDPATDRWILTKQKMMRPRSRHTATLLLSSGKVLIVGGVEGIPVGGQPLASAELYDPTADTWSLAGRMARPRADHIAVLMSDGKVLVAGGTQKNDGYTKTNEAEVYDPSTNSWTPIQKMHILRAYFTAVLTPTGQVLVIGGRSGDGTTSTMTAEIYDPVTRSWSMTNDMTYNREVSLGQNAMVLNDGRILVVGGDSSGTSEIYSPHTDTWTTPLKMNSVRSYGATSKLKSGQILVAGGSDCLCNNPHILASAEIYTPT